MGRYLGIGIVTEVSTNKTEAIKALSGEDAAKDYLNRRYNPTGLYDFTDNGSYNFTLKRDIVRREWIDVLKAFCPMRYPEWKDDTNIIGSLQALDDPEKCLRRKRQAVTIRNTPSCFTTMSLAMILGGASFPKSI